jgi:hypothetical protein
MKNPREFIKWSESAIGSIYQDEKGEMYVYDEKMGMLIGFSDKIKGRKIRVMAEVV